MADQDGAPVRGRTRWRRVPLVLVPLYAVLAGMLYLGTSGSLAVSFAVSGTQFDTFADSLSCTTPDTNGRCFYQMGVFDVTRQSGAPVQSQVESIIPNATIKNLCQSVSVQPPLGLPRVTVITRAGTDPAKPVTASGLVTDASTTTATQADFSDFKVGQDLSGFSNPQLTVPVPIGPATGADVQSVPVPVGTFGQTAATVNLQGLHSTGSGTQAATFTLPGLSLTLGGSCP
jgi:Family of unknown function (DUF6230)